MGKVTSMLRDAKKMLTPSEDIYITVGLTDQELKDQGLTLIDWEDFLELPEEEQPKYMGRIIIKIEN